MSASDSSLDAYARTPVLVLGASGFIGGWVVQALAALGAEVSAVVRNPSRAASADRRGAHNVVVADLTMPDSLRGVITTVAPAVTFNLAGYGVDHSERDPVLTTALNTQLVDDLVDVVRTLPDKPGWTGLRLVQVGSALEYGPVQGTITEDMEPAPTTDYGRTKLAGTRTVLAAARSTSLSAAVGRLFTVYGPGEHAGRLLPSLIKAARTDSIVKLTSGEQPRDFTYVEDAAEGLLRLGSCRSASGTVLNVATGRLTTVREFVETGAGVLGIPPERLQFGAVPQQKSEMFHGVVDTSRVERVLGWRPAVSVAEGIRRTWEEERSAQ